MKQNKNIKRHNMDAISRSKSPLSRLMALADLLKDRNLLTMQKGFDW
jgi:hypothetical protein